MSGDSDPPGDTIVVGGTYDTSEDESLVDDDGLDLYSEDGEPQENVNDQGAADDPANATGASDAYAASFDSPPREEDDTSPAQEEAAPAVSGSPEPSSVEQPQPADPSVPDQSNSRPSPQASSASPEELSSPSVSGSEPVETSPPAQAQVVVTSPQPAHDAEAQQPAPAQEQPEPEPQPAADCPPVDPPKSALEDSNVAENDVNIAFEIQELVNDIRAASPSASSSSASSDSSGQMQLDAESPAAAADQASSSGNDATASESVPPVLPPQVPQPADTPSQAQPEDLAQKAESAPISMLPSVPIPTAPAASTHPVTTGKKGQGGVNKGAARGAKNNAQPPSGPAATREPPSGPKGQSGHRQGANARNAGQQTYDMFLADERRYTAEGKWEKFPEGSRIFVGNLSQERVSKKEVFNLFHKYGRLAQISLKAAYGFVQYHNAAEAAEAIKHLQGVDVRGRKINLEVSKTQKKGGKDRERSPDRNHKKTGRKGDSYDGRDGGRDGGRSTDGYRPNYEPHGRRSGDDYGRGRNGERGRSRSRSRSPRPFSRSEGYRQRSPPRAHGDNRPYPGGGDRGAQPPRDGTPDAQILLLQDVHKDFVQYVQKAFTDRGLKTDVMFVDPRFLDSIVQRQIVDGAHAVVKLDMHAQSVGKVSLQTFNRTPGTLQVAFDEYRDLDVNVAAELVVQTKRRSQPAHLQQPPAYQQGPQAAAGYPQAYPPQSYPAYPMNPQAVPSVLPGAIGQVDPALLQKVLMSLHGQQPQPGAPPVPAAYGAPAHAPVPASAQPPPMAHLAMGGAAPSQIDINAILNNLKKASAAPAPAPVSAPYGVAGYPTATASPGPVSPTGPAGVGSAPPGAMDPSQQVQSIMAQLSRFR